MSIVSDGVKGCRTGRPAGLLRICLALIGLICLLAACAVAAPATPQTTPKKWESITLLYHSDVGGKIEPCG